jgi:hypothetical protein
MGNQIKAHKQKKHTHGKSSQNLGALEAKWMANARSLPDFKVAQNVHSHTKKRSK